MRNPINFPAEILKPVRNFLKREEKELVERKKSLAKEDPFADPARLGDNAAVDAEAAEQFGHARIEAMHKEIDRRLIEIRKALSRIKIGKYGVCQECGDMIDTDRLTIKPEATLCIVCERKKGK
ncbi:MAG: TraR/DksA C4-type zinc finger protein [bacterium]|nr:TraR/DksA C4-type zinc finger protein [bacterium]